MQSDHNCPISLTFNFHQIKTDRMRRCLYTILLSLVIFYGSQAQNDLDDGPTKFYYGNGQVSSEGFIKEGKPDGLWKTYYVGGQLKSIGKRNNFELDSIWLFYNEQGYISEEVSYLRGKKSGYTTKYQLLIKNDSLVNSLLSKDLFLDNLREGQGKYYNGSGLLNRIVSYKNGKKHGLTFDFNSDSLIQIVYKYHNDFLIDREFINQSDDNGLRQGLWKSFYSYKNIRKEENYKDNVLHGYYREYDERGRLLEAKFYDNGLVIQREEAADIQVEIINQYDDNGKVIASGGFINDVAVGLHREYTADKSVIKIKEFNNSGQIIADGISDDKGQKDEYWKFYFSGGNIRSEGNFRDNKRIGLWKFYFPNKLLEQEGNYKNGLEDGLWTWYYPDGSLRREESYYRGEEDGMSVEYDNKGVIIAQGEFIEGFEEGEWIYKIGDQIEKGVYKAGERDGLWQHFFSDETIKFSGSFVQGYKNGRHKYYFESGKLKEERFYEMGVNQKIWRKYDDEGNILLALSYSNGILIKIDGVRVNIEN